MLEPVCSRLSRAVRAAAGILLLVVALTVVMTILGRYIGFATAWADEVARIAFVWSASLGAASGIHRGSHFAISMLPETHAGRRKQLLEATIVLVMMSLCGVLVWTTTVSIPIASLSRLPTLGVSGVWFQSAIGFFAVLAGVFLAGRFVAIWRRG